jgi:hypothetical protein
MAQVSIPTGNPIVAAAGSSGALSPRPGLLVGFICTVSGTLNLFDGADANGTPAVVALPVTAGQFVNLPITFKAGIFYSLAAAAGTFIVGY